MSAISLTAESPRPDLDIISVIIKLPADSFSTVDLIIALKAIAIIRVLERSLRLLHSRIV